MSLSHYIHVCSFEEYFWVLHHSVLKGVLGVTPFSFKGYLGVTPFNLEVKRDESLKKNRLLRTNVLIIYDTVNYDLSDWPFT